MRAAFYFVAALIIGVSATFILASALRPEPEFTDEELRTCQDIVDDGYDARTLEELDAVLDRAESAHCPTR